MALYGYARVSSREQDLSVQREALKNYGCERIREEQVSGGSRQNRRELQVLLDFVGAGDTIVVTKLDRLARNTLDMLEIVRDISAKGADFVSIAEPWACTKGSGKLLLTIFAGMAEWERERIRERQAEGIAFKKKTGARYHDKPRAPKYDPVLIRSKAAAGMRPCDIRRELGCSEATVFRALDTLV